MQLEDLRDGAELSVLVVGANAPGFFAAAQLAKLGIASVVIDSAFQASAFSKAMLLQPRSLEFLHGLGLATSLVEMGKKLDRLAIFHAGKKLATLGMTTLPSLYPFSLSLPQNDLEQVLLKYIHQINLPVFRGVRVVSLVQSPGTPGVQVALTLPGGKVVRVNARQVIACDSSNSQVRKLLGIPFTGKDLPIRLIRLDTHLEGFDLSQPDPHSDEANQIHMHEEGMLTICPSINKGMYRLAMERLPSQIELETKPPKNSRHTFPLPALEIMQGILQKRCGNPTLRIIGDPIGEEITCHSRLVPHMQKGHVFLAGDAAHIHTALGGLGLNAALADIANLVWKIALVEKGLAWPRILESYQDERLPIVQDLMNRCIDFESCSPNLKGLAHALCDGLQRFLPSLQAVQEQGSRLISRLAVEYRQSPLVQESQETLLEAVFSHGIGGVGIKAWRAFRSGLRAGDRVPALPWPASTLPHGAATIMDLLSDGLHHAFIFAGPNASTATIERAAQVAKAIQVRGPGIGLVACHLLIDPASGEIPQGITEGLHVVHDTDNLLAHDFGYQSDGICIIRPDGHLGFHSQPAEFNTVQEWLATIFTR